jgi:predicted nicotinamide N-methyase
MPALTPAEPLDHAAFVLASTSVSTAPMVPEIKLYLGQDAISIWEGTEAELGRRDQQPPFWAFAWAGGQALARYLLDHPKACSGRSVLDLGSGSGLTAIAAAITGATAVLASELDPFAIAAISLNAQLNDVPVATTGDVLDGDGQPANVVLAADIWYERQLAARALGLLRRAADRGATVLVGDVGRAFLPHEALREVASYDIPVLADLENTAVKHARILTLR